MLHSKARPPPVVSIDSGGHRERFLAKRNALVESHLYLVPPIAQRIHRGLPPSFDLDDLCSTGYLALLHLATRYHPRTHGGAPFASFARPRIRGAILNSIRRNAYTENTRPPIDTEPRALDKGDQINSAIDSDRFRQRLINDLAELPERLRRSNGKFVSFAEQIAEAHEWRAAAGHVKAIAALRKAA